MKHIFYSIKLRLAIMFICLFSLTNGVHALESNSDKILIITSYNPETRSMADNISAFVDQYKKNNGVYSIIVESMNCQNLSEIFYWKNRMKNILAKYDTDSPPALIVLLGQEACTSFLSQDYDFAKRIPVFIGLASANSVSLPSDSVNLSLWQPKSKDIYKDFNDFNIAGGYVYKYDVDKNLELIRKFYPNLKKIFFLSDNTYGGVSINALVRKEAAQIRDFDVEYIDGRNLTFMEVSEKIRNMSSSDCVLVGTWRIDCTENYVLGSTTYMLHDANPLLPVFTLSSVGLGHWTLGGYMPDYHNIGRELSDMVNSYIMNGRRNTSVKTISSVYKFDSKRLTEFKKDSIRLPENSVYVNRELSFYERYEMLVNILIVVFVFLIICIMGAFYYILKINKLKHHLEVSSRELLIAKEKAEESNLLKSSFLANMSHEIRTPLNAIVGFSSVISTENLTKEEKIEYSNIISKNSDLLLHLINDILDISRMESGKIKFVKEDADIVDLCLMALSTVEYSRKTEAEFNFTSNVKSLIINTDIQRIKQVLINLLSNAAKFTKEGFITIDLKVVEEEKKLYISVQDTGCGIDAEKKEKIFDRFEKLNEYSQGTGLGLSISKLIVERLGGTIWLDTDYTSGSRFVFTHPL